MTDDELQLVAQETRRLKGSKNPGGRPRKHPLTEKEALKSYSNAYLEQNPNLMENMNARVANLVARCMEISQDSNKQDPETLMYCLKQYVAACSELDMKFANMMCYMACGVSKQDIDDWASGQLKKSDPRYKQFAIMCRSICGSSREQLAVEGKINPVFAIWQQKVHDGFNENQVITIAQDTDIRRSSEEIAEEFKDL